MNVRIHPDLHRIAARERAEGEASITEIINRAVAVGFGREDLLLRIGLDSPTEAVPSR